MDDEIYCRLVKKNILASELGISVRSLERRIVAGEYRTVSENPRRVWVAIESEATPERLKQLVDLNEDLKQRNSDLELQLSRCQALYADDQRGHREVLARVKQLEPENTKLNGQVKHFSSVAQTATTDAAAARQEADKQRARDAALIEQMTAGHQQEIANLKKKNQHYLAEVVYISRTASANATETGRRRTRIGTWVGMLVGAVLCACVMIGGALLLG